MAASSGGSSGSAGSLPMAWTRRRGSRRRPGRARSAARRAWPPRPRGCASSRSGCSGRKRWRYHWPVASSRVHAGRVAAERAALPVVRAAPPSRRGGRARCTSRRFGDVRRGDRRDSTNHGCWSEVWLGTQSTRTLEAARRGPRPAGGRSRRACRRAGRRRSSRSRRSRSRPWGSGRTGDSQMASTPSHAQVVEVAPDALEVADPVAVRVGEGAGVDLVDDGGLPPRLVGHRRTVTGRGPRSDVSEYPSTGSLLGRGHDQGFAPRLAPSHSARVEATTSGGTSPTGRLAGVGTTLDDGMLSVLDAESRT